MKDSLIQQFLFQLTAGSAKKEMAKTEKQGCNGLSDPGLWHFVSISNGSHCHLGKKQTQELIQEASFWQFPSIKTNTAVRNVSTLVNICLIAVARPVLEVEKKSASSPYSVLPCVSAGISNLLRLIRVYSLFL